MVVRFINKKAREEQPAVYPPVGTLGVVLADHGSSYFVKWAKESIGMGDAWICPKSFVQFAGI